MTTRKVLIVFFSIFMCCTLYAGNIHAAWSSDPAVNTPISTATGNQKNPTIISDGSGGAIITWSSGKIYAQRVNALGVVQWAINGVEIRSGSADTPTIISDGSGGAIITWKDYRNSNWDIYAQRINFSGVVQWTTNGVVICTAVGHQENPTITSDGSGGAIITWDDQRNFNDPDPLVNLEDIYAQRISSSGVVQWTPNGAAICTQIHGQGYPSITSDGSGGAIITWCDSRNGSYVAIYAQRVNALGVVQWILDGVAINTEISSLRIFYIISDGNGGAIITWMDNRNSNWDIYAQRINFSGVVQWTPNGVAICIAERGQYTPTITSDNSGGAIITWQDDRNSNWDIYAQRINFSGVVQWTPNGVAISTAESGQRSPTITSDGSAGAIITWGDSRNDYEDIYAQRINASGVVQWTPNGVAISTAEYSSQESPTITSDGSGGAIITWMDDRNGNDDIYAQYINAIGTLTPIASLQVSLTPQGAIDDGAHWQVDGSEWRNSGQTVVLSLGEHTIAFQSVPYWTTPVNQTVTIAQDQTTIAMGTYVQLVKGDVNGDNQVNLTDLILCLQILSGLIPDNINPAADVDGDGKIGMAEAIYAIRTTAGL